MAAFFTTLPLLSLLVALMAAIDAALIGYAQPHRPAQLSAEARELDRALRRGLREPIVSVGVLLLLAFGGAFVPPFVKALLGGLLLLLALSSALRGPALPIRALRDAHARLLALGLARWATLALPILLPPGPWALLTIGGAALGWGTMIWAKGRIDNLPARVAPKAAPQPAPAAPPPPAMPAEAAITRPLPAELPALPPLPCASCGAPAPLAAPFCPSCGLFFASRVPALLAPLADRGYNVLRPLGAGGMSAVYLAYDQPGAAWCGVKTVVSVDPTGDLVWRREAAASLAREAALLAGLDHPRIARMIDWLDDQERPCLVLDLVPGGSLDQRCGAALPPAQALRWGHTVAEALGYLAEREQAIVHGDIKPANLLLSGAPARPTLIDFGAAARLDPRGGALQPHVDYGTPGYAAPEQYRGQIGLASDVYGLGATLYQLLSGDDPTRHPLQFPALAALPAATRQALAAALDPDPAARPSARQLAAQLRRLAG